eukprot:gnl/MRDRNA2_/MRDRNA2_19927_c0_seq1.p1 gnl/MRDRNA2_/MRDRNA2_19927_c0~~gnl/MRDRNA2_/MRDRNA2_19927_c0_seq1.p1  ORF type:complete len:457 (+),score=58.73 gnl/MRDRNA2_/MRDRNA2_19927_c0_seq1:46-1416(+)
MPPLVGTVTATYQDRGECFIQRDLNSQQFEMYISCNIDCRHIKGGMQVIFEFAGRTTGGRWAAKNVRVGKMPDGDGDRGMSARVMEIMCHDIANVELDRKHALEIYNLQKVFERKAGDAKERELQQLVSDLAGSKRAQNADLVSDIIMKAAAWLSPPRLRSSKTSSNQMDEAARQRLQKVMQSKLRVAVLDALNASKLIDRSNRKVQAALCHICAMIKRFEEINGCLDYALSGKQWVRLKDAVSEQTADCEGPSRSPKRKQVDGVVSGNKKPKLRTTGIESIADAGLYPAVAKIPKPQHAWTVEEKRNLENVINEMQQQSQQRLSLAEWNTVSSQFGRSVSSVRKAYSMLCNPDYARPAAALTKHKNGVLRNLMTDAMEKLGGSGTMHELLECCRSDLDLQNRYEDQLIQRSTKLSGHTNEIPQWEASVRANMTHAFSQLLEKRGGHIVFTLKRKK